MLEPTKIIGTLVLVAGLGWNSAAAQTVTAFPYFEDFESGAGGFVGTGDWELGTPSTADIPAAASGLAAWVTNLDGNTTGVDSFLTSPTFDFAGFVRDPIVELEITYELDNRLARLSMSLDGGPFERVGFIDDPGAVAWYGVNSSGIGWVETQQPWTRARHELTGAAGHAAVLRFEVLNPPTYGAGLGVDDLSVFEPAVGSGQAPRAGVATFDVSGALEAGGFPVVTERPGPYFVEVSAASDLATFSFDGAPGQVIALYAGGLSVGLASFGSIGQVDLAPGFYLVASGSLPGGLNPFFQTTVDGSMNLSLAVPPTLVGRSVTYQALLTHPTLGLALSNAVQVEFVP